MADWKTNSMSNERTVTLDISADTDDGVFLALDSPDIPGVDLIITDRAEVEQFQREVNEACERFYSLTRGE